MDDLNKEKIKKYLEKLHKSGESRDVVKRKLSSVKKFLDWNKDKGYIKEKEYQEVNDVLKSKIKSQKSKLQEKIQKLFHFKFPISKQVSNIQQPISSFGLQHYIGLVVILVFMAVLGAGIYNRFFLKSQSSLAYSTAPIRAGRMLSFQGRLTDVVGNPIITPTNVTFRLYNTASGGSAIYTTGACSITPDEDGILNTLIGGAGYTPTPPTSSYNTVCGTEVPANIFSENANVYLGVTVASADPADEMTPRQQIANVGYAINSETLQGLPPGTGAANIPYINAGGDLLIATANPGIRSTFTSSAFTISSAQATTIQSAGTGDIVLQATESGTLKIRTGGTTDTYTRLAVTNEGNVGIGTTAPANKLDVAGTVQMTGFKLTTTPTNNYVLTSDVNGVGTWQPAASGVGGSGTATYIPRWTAGTTLGNSALFDLSGNIGIGTTAPGKTLDISGTARTSSDLTVLGDIYSGSYIRPTSGYLSFRTANTSGAAFTFQTSTPSVVDTFGVTGSLYLGGSSLPVNMLDVNGGTAIGTYAGTTAPTNGLIVSGNVGIGTTAPLSKLGVLGNLSVGATYGTVNAPTSGAIFEGNVGIGTTSPSRILDVSGDALMVERAVDSAAVLLKRTGSNTKEFFFGVSASSGANNGFFQIADYGAAQEVGPYNRFVINNNGDIGFGSSGTNSITSGLTNASMVVLGTGNVGIGITAPGYQLDVQGTNGYVNAKSGLCIGGVCQTAWSGVTGYWTGYGNNIANNNTGNVGIGTTAPISKLGVLGNLSVGTTYGAVGAPTSGAIIEGNVGIGTTAPIAQLSMRDSVGPDSSTFMSFDNTANSFVQDKFYLKVARTTTIGRLELSSDSFIQTLDIAQTGRVGIHEPQPTATLQVNGDSTWGGVSPVFRVSRGSSYVGTIDLNYNYNDLSTGVTGGVLQSSSNLSIIAANGDNILFGNGTAEKVRIDSSGNVGIGTTGPGAVLDVGGNTAGNIQTILARGADPLFQLISANGTGNTTGSLETYLGLRYLGTNNATAGIDFYRGGGATDSYLGLKTNGVDQMTILANGNVGIGTTSPGYQLDVQGTNGYINALSGLCINGTCKTSWNTGSQGYWTGFDNNIANNNTGNVGIGTTAPSEKLDVSGGAILGNGLANLRLTGTANTMWLESYNGTRDATGQYLTFSGYQGANRTMTLDLTNSYVGIGTTSPGYKLEIQGGTGIAIFGQSSSNYGVWGYTGASTGVRGTSSSYGIGVYGDSSSGTGVEGISSSGYGGYFTSSTGPSLITGTGNVGIGTTGPTANLSVLSSTSSDTPGNSLVLQLSSGALNQGFGFRYSSDVSKLMLDREYGSTWYGPVMTFDRTNGNVGIGTTTPGYQLDVQGTNGYINAKTGLCINGACQTTWVGGAGYWTGYGNNIGNNNTGNVGIGTTSPNYKLEVNGTGYFSGALSTNSYLQVGGTTPTTYSRFGTNSSGWGLSGASDVLISGNSEIDGQLYVDGLGNNIFSGNVGIGTATPSEKLDVAGNIQVKNNANIAGSLWTNQYTESSNSQYNPAANALNGNSTGGYWTKATINSPSSSNHTSLVYDGKMWIIGGGGGGSFSNKVYYSTDGITWTQAGTDTLPVATAFLTSLVYDGKMWIIGGETGSGFTQKVYYSTDGITWTQAGTDALPVATAHHTSLVYDGKMWVIGGDTGSGYSQKVYYSTNGITWTQAGSDALPVAVNDHSSLVYDGKMWVIGGDTNSGYSQKVYYSTNGSSWTEAGTDALPVAIADFSSLVYDGKMWVFGGIGDTNYDHNNYFRKVYYSTNGSSWTESSTNALPADGGFYYFGFTSLVYNGRMWLIGVNGNKVYYSTPTVRGGLTVADNSGSELLRVDNSGRVGIGTTALNRKLSVGGNVLISGGDNMYTFSYVKGITNTGLDSPMAVTVSGNYAYIASSLNNTLSIFDISNPDSIVARGKITTGLSSPQSVVVSGSYAYVVSANNNTLAIFDVSNPDSIGALGTITTGLSSPKSIAVSGSYAYVVSPANNTLSIFNISNPNAIVARGTTTTGLLYPDRVAVSGSYAYVISSLYNTLSIFNIANPDSIVARGTTNSNLNFPYSIAVSGNYAYVVNAGSWPALAIFDVSNPDSITTRGTTIDSLNTPHSVAVSGNYAYVANAGGNTLSIYNISNPDTITTVGVSSSGFNLETPESVVVSGDYAYIANVYDSSLSILNISDPTFSAPESYYSALDVAGAVSVGTYSGKGGAPANSLVVSGNVGIGTTSPSYKLDIAGTDNNFWGAQITNDETGDSAVATLALNSDSATGGIGVASSTFDGGGTYSHALGGLASRTVVASYIGPGLTMASIGSGSDIRFNTGLTDRMIIDSGGNVGIGTTGPSEQLTIGGSNTGTFALRSATAPNDYYVKLTNNYSSSNPFALTAYYGTEVLAMYNSGDTHLGSYNKSGAMVIQSTTGNVGIGTTAPTAKLSIGGTTSTISNNTGNITITPASNLIISSGNVGIGTTAPGQNLSVIGTAGLSTGTLWTNTSDARVKQNIDTIPNALDVISALRPAQYMYTSSYLSNHPEIDNVLHFGFIAQEFQQVFPNSVATDGQGYLTVNQTNVIPYTVKAIQEQQVEIASQSLALNNLTTTINNLTLTDTGDLNITKDSGGNYQLTNTSNNSIIDKVGAFSSAVVANFKAGLIQAENIIVNNTLTAKNIVAENLNITTANIQIAGQSLQQFIDDRIQTALNSKTIVSPIAQTENITATGTAQLNQIQTNEIKPKDNNDIIVSLSNDSIANNNGAIEQSNNENKGQLARLIIKGFEGKTTTVIDAAGNASFSGQLVADSLSVNNEATISGNLVANNAQFNNVTMKQLNNEGDASISGTLVADRVNAKNIDELTTSNQSLSTDINDIQKLLADIKTQPVPNLSNQTNLSNTTDLTNSDQQFNNVTMEQLTVIGQSNFYNTSVSNSLLVGTTLIENNSITSLASELKFNAMSQINLLDGAVIIARDGTITSKGELIAQGGVRTDEIKGLTDTSPVTINNLVTDNLAINDKYLEATTSASIIAPADNFEKNGIFAPAIETATTSAGIGILPANQSEVIVYNDRVNKDSLIYLTPTNQSFPSTLTVTKKEDCSSTPVGCKKYFKVGINAPVSLDNKFNWLIIN